MGGILRLFGKRRIRLCGVRAAQQIIGAGVIQVGQLCEQMGGNFPLAYFVGTVYALVDAQHSCYLFCVSSWSSRKSLSLG